MLDDLRHALGTDRRRQGPKGVRVADHQTRLMKRAAQPDEMNMRGIVSVYGQTESSPGSTMSAWTDSLELRTETVGYAFPHVQCKVIDPETGKELPDVKAVACSNYIDVNGVFDPETGIIKLFTAQDNLGKGAALQAIQAANAMFGFNETTGLKNIVRGI